MNFQNFPKILVEDHTMRNRRDFKTVKEEYSNVLEKEIVSQLLQS